jgi:hypothetical protein
MAIIDKSKFLQEFGHREIDIIKLTNDVEEGHALYDIKSQLLALDVDKDGKLRGEAEIAALFELLNSIEGPKDPVMCQIYDQCGIQPDGFTTADGTFTTTHKAGQLTPAGRAHEGILQAAEPETNLEGEFASATTFGEKVGLAGKRYLERRTNQHYDGVETTGIGVLYGNKSAFAQLSAAEKQAYLLEHSSEGTHPPMPTQTSCIEWGMEVLAHAYRDAGRAARFQAILAVVKANKYTGTSFLQELQKDSWQSIYWICDDRWIPETGESLLIHSTDLGTVRSTGKYWGVRVDRIISNYRPNRDASIPEAELTARDMSGVETLRRIPFFVGIAKRAIHCFVGRDGRVNEQHWACDPVDKMAIQERPFEAFGWTSGILMVPPGSWPDA